MKSLLISEIFPPKVGGSGRWFWEIYSRLPAEKYLIVAGNDEAAAAFDAAHKLKSLRWPLTMQCWGLASWHSLRSYLNLFLKMVQLLRSESIRTIHCGRCLPEGLLAWCAGKLFNIPYLVYVHGEELPTYKTSRELSFLSKMIYAGARIVVVNSRNSKEAFIAHTGLSDATLRIMHPGVDAAYFIPAEHTPDTLPGWKGRCVLLTVGRLQKRKGHDHVILSLKHIRESVPNILYAIVGDGEERNYLEDLVVKEGLCEHVQFLGKVDDATLLACYQHCNLFILANREVNGDFEGFGMVLVEAQACGKPVIAGISGGTTETMIPEVTGILVDADNLDAIAAAVIYLMNDEEKRNKMGSNATEWVRSKFDWNKLAEQAQGIFEEMKPPNVMQ